METAGFRLSLDPRRQRLRVHATDPAKRPHIGDLDAGRHRRARALQRRDPTLRHLGGALSRHCRRGGGHQSRNHCLSTARMIPPTKAPQQISTGEKLPALERTFTLVDLVLYGAATWDWNRMHYDVEHTRRLNLRAPVIDGQEFGAFFARAALEWAGPRALVKRLAFRMKAMA